MICDVEEKNETVVIRVEELNGLIEGGLVGLLVEV